MTDPHKAAASGGARLTAALVLAASSLASPAWADDATPGLRVVKDPVTGALRAPTADEAAALDAVQKTHRRAPRGLLTGKVSPAAIHHPDGTVEQELDESSMSYMVATRNADGTTSVACVTGSDAATALLKRKQPVGRKLQEQLNDR